MSRLAVVFDHLGPYHASRLSAAARLGHVVALELASRSKDYAWDEVGGADSFERVTVLPGQDTRAAGAREMRARVGEALTRARPGVVAVAGWSDPGALAALAWCRRAAVPAVVMSESQARDGRRVWWKEAIKRRVTCCFSAGLVGGSLHVEYLAALGMPRERIFTGYDVVDNDYFARGADAARQHAVANRERLGLPERYFLASSRFIEKKNLFTLLRAYEAYRGQAGPGAWKLVLLGDGPLREPIEALRRQFGLEGAVALPGFKQYPELPVYYGLAGAFVHASTTEQWGLVVNEAMAAGLPVIVSERCGCAPDLVVPGRNGYLFDPCRDEELTGHLLMAAGGGYDLAALGGASREIIRRWSPRTFADNLWAAAELALRAPRPPKRLFEVLLLGALIRRAGVPFVSPRAPPA